MLQEEDEDGNDTFFPADEVALAGALQALVPNMPRILLLGRVTGEHVTSSLTEGRPG
jgi:hypothetical protein